MKYFEMFTGIAGFSKGIEQAYDDHYQYESANVEAQSGRNRNADIGRDGVLSANESALRNGGARMPECIGFSEIGKVANGILEYHYPDVRNYGDASLIVSGELPDFDFLCGGFPCQAFSIAGKRQGFNEARGTLFFEIARILSHKRPAHFLLENVEGLRSHEGGSTLQEILRILSELDYRVETVLLNSKHYGVPQNRERIFFIGHSGKICQREILSFGDGNSEITEAGYVEPISGTISTKNQSGQCNFDGSTTLIYGKDGKRKPKDIASTLTAGGHLGGNHSDMDLIIGTLRTHKDGEGFREMQSDVSPTLNARARQDGSQQPIIAVPVLTPDRPTKRQNGRRMKEQGEASFTLTAQDRHGVMVAANNERAGSRIYESDGIAATVTANVTGGTKNERYKVENRIRRLTPVECARLQGFPDNHADFGSFENKHGEWHVREISDTGKYQVFGNAVTVNVIQAIIRQMLEQGCLADKR